MPISTRTKSKNRQINSSGRRQRRLIDEDDEADLAFETVKATPRRIRRSHIHEKDEDQTGDDSSVMTHEGVTGSIEKTPPFPSGTADDERNKYDENDPVMIDVLGDLSGKKIDLLTLVMKKVVSMQLKRLREKMPVNNTTCSNICNALQTDYRQLCEQNSQVKHLLSTETIEMVLRKGVDLGVLRWKEVTLIEEDAVNPNANPTLNPTPNPIVTTSTTITPSATSIVAPIVNPTTNLIANPNTDKRSQIAYIAQPRAVKALDVAEIEEADFVEVWKRSIPANLYTTADKVKWRAPWMGREIIVQWDGEKEAYKAVVQLVLGWNIQLNRPVVRRKKQKTDGCLKIQYTLDGFNEEINPDSYDWYFAKPGQFSKNFFKKLRARGVTLDFLTDESASCDEKRSARKRSRQEFEKSDATDVPNEIDAESEQMSPLKKQKLEIANNTENEKLQTGNSASVVNMLDTLHINDNVLFESPTKNNYIYYGSIANINAITQECEIQLFKNNDGNCCDTIKNANLSESDATHLPDEPKTEVVKLEYIVKQDNSNDDILKRVCSSCGRYFEETNNLEYHRDTTTTKDTENDSNP